MSISQKNEGECFMTTKRKNKISGWFRKIPLNIGTFYSLGHFLLYMVITVILYLTADHIQSYQVTAGPLSNNKTYTALAIREESVVNTNAAGYITYYARENSKLENPEQSILWGTLRHRLQSMN